MDAQREKPRTMTVLTRRKMHLEDSWDHRGAMDMGGKVGVSADAKLQI